MLVRERVDAELLASLDLTRSMLGADFMGTLDAPRRRARFAEFLRKILPAEQAFPQIARTDLKIPGPPGEPEVGVRLYRAARGTAANAAILFIHGGGFNIGSVEQEDAPAALLANELGVLVVSVEYRLAPEHPHPAPVNDCYAALSWMAREAAQLGVDPARIAVYGHSAGGGLAANVALMARDRKFPQVAYQMLCYPMLDHRMTSPSFTRLSGLGVWDRGANTEAWQALLADAADHDGAQLPAYAAAAHAHNVAGLPETYIDVGDLDVLLDQDLAYAWRLMEGGVAVELHVYPGAYHGFDAFAPLAAVSHCAVQARLAALRRVLRISSHAGV